MTIGSILCSAAGLLWAVAIIDGDTPLRTLQLIFIGVSLCGICVGGVAVYKGFAVRTFDKLLACLSVAASFVVFAFAVLVPWIDEILDEIEEYVKWSLL